MKNQKITIITPTYNRAYILNKAYESLVNQTNKEFIWMIIDDGSTDETELIVKEWLKESTFKVLYYKKMNGGKASALNFALDRIETKYYVCLDSDDIFTQDAIELALNELYKIDDNDEYCGVLALRTTNDGNVLGGKQIPESVTDIKVIELSNKYSIKSELICFYKTNIGNKYRFPIIEGEKFISPAYVELKIGKKYKFLVSRNKYCICEYLEDGLTRNKKEVIIKNPKGYTIVIKEAFEMSDNFIIKSKNCLMYICGSILSKDKAFIKKSPHKIMTILYYPLGYIAYIFRFKIRKFI